MDWDWGKEMVDDVSDGGDDNDTDAAIGKSLM